MRSPPLSTLTFFVEASPPNMKAPRRSLIFVRISPSATSSMVWKTVRVSSSMAALILGEVADLDIMPRA